jgi:hypothetical protein
VPFDSELLEVADRLLDFIRRETGHAGIVHALNGAVERASRSAAEQGAALVESTSTIRELRTALERLAGVAR